VLGGATLLIYTGFIKLLSPDSFALALASHGLVPEPIVGQAAAAVMWGEVGVGAAALVLAAGWSRPRTSALLLCVVAGALAWYAAGMALFPPPEPVSCGCGLGGDEPADWHWIALRSTGAAAVLALAGLALGGQGHAGPPRAHRLTPPAGPGTRWPR
jgi:hypothetical protein